MRRLSALLCVVLVIGCEGGTQPTVAPFTFRLPSSAPALTNARLAALIGLVAGSAAQPGLLNSFWSDALTGLGNDLVYHPPTDVLPYPPGGSIDTQCSGDETGEKWFKNAYYCPVDQVIAWEQSWFGDMETDIGDLAPVAVLAHEWGHHIQHLSATPALKFNKEDQADCYSGSFFRHADDAGWLAEYTPGGKIGDAVAAIYRLGNSRFVQSTWFGNYGPPRSRQLAFGMGLLGLSPAVCLLYQDYVYQPAISLGWYTLDPPASFSLSALGQGQLLSHDDLKAVVTAYPDLGVQPAAEQFDAAAKGWFGDADYHWVGDLYVNPFGDRLGGTAAVRGYEQQLVAADGSSSTIHGDLVLQADPGHGGILFDVYRPGASPADQAGWDELIQWVAIIANGLCPGGEGTDICPTAAGR